MKKFVWFKSAVSVVGLAAFCVLATGSTDSGSKGSPGGGNVDAADQAAMQELQTNAWAKELYVERKYMNIGVIRNEKDWNSPAITSYACGVIRKHGSSARWVRFVDIEAVRNQRKTPMQAEIYTGTCS